MNKQELLKQADYTFQRGNRKLAKKYLADITAAYPNDETAWMLLARVVEEKESKAECYQRAIRINPNNSEAKIALARLNYSSETFDKKRGVFEAPKKSFKRLFRGLVIFAALALALGSVTFVIARNNPESRIAKLIIPAAPTAYANALADNIASKTRAEVGAKYPQYASLADALIGFALKSAENGMDGAPERPGVEIVPSDSAGREALIEFQKSLPKPGSLSSVLLNEQQATSWLAMAMKNNPDLPLGDIQVYLRDDKIQIWGMITGSDNSTSALVVARINVDINRIPNIEIVSAQIGGQIIPDTLLSQAQGWLNQWMAEKINEQAPGLQVMNVNISNGLITISGMR